MSRNVQLAYEKHEKIEIYTQASHWISAVYLLIVVNFNAPPPPSSSKQTGQPTN